MSCPICGKRPPKRFCPAKGEKICALCCGQEREVTIDCPVDCAHLISAHRYETEHRKPPSAQEFPYREVQVEPDFVYEHWHVIHSLASLILRSHIQNKELTDSTAIAAIEALAVTYRTLGTGIYYERPPDAPMARALYDQLTETLQESRQAEAAHTGLPALRDSEVFRLLVFFIRVAKQETNGRRLSRAFLEFLRARFPLPAEEAKEEPRIIVP